MLQATLSVARKEFLHILRDRRILILLLTLPSAFTLLFGHAFEASAIKGVPALLLDEDRSEASGRLGETLRARPEFAWRTPARAVTDGASLLKADAGALLTIPAGWAASLQGGTPASLTLLLDGSDTNTALNVQGVIQEVLGRYQQASRGALAASLVEQLAATGTTLPVEVQRALGGSVEPWKLDTRILFNPQLRFIEFVVPGIIGLILQLLAVTLMACTITREREAGTFSQLMVTSLRRSEIVVGKVLPYLAISALLVLMTLAVTHFHFGVRFQQPAVLALLCLLFLLSSLGLGLLISAFCHNQTQAIQFAVFYLLPVFPLSGAFASIDLLPREVKYLSNTFPLTHFCRAFRDINLRGADIAHIAPELLFLAGATVVTCVGAGLLLRRAAD